MQVFNIYFLIFKKQIKAILIYTGIFLGLILIMVQNVPDHNPGEFTNKKVPVLVLNEEEQNGLVRGFLDYLGDYVEYIDIKDSKEARQDALFYHRVEYILTIPKGFTDDLMSGKEVQMEKQTLPNSANIVSVDNAIDNYFNTAKVYIKQIPGIDDKKLNDFIGKSMQNKSTVMFDINQSAMKRDADKFNLNYFNYLAYIIIAGFIVCISMIMLSFHDTDIKRRQNASPMTFKKLNIQLLAANLIFVLAFLILYFAAGYVFNPYRRLDSNTILFYINTIIFALTALSISYLVGITVKSKRAVSAISTVTSLGLAFLSGVFVPQEYLGDAVLKVASFTPTYWFVKANNAIVSLNNYEYHNLKGIFADMLIQVGFTVVLITITMVISKRKRQQAS